MGSMDVAAKIIPLRNFLTLWYDYFLTIGTRISIVNFDNVKLNIHIFLLAENVEWAYKKLKITKSVHPSLSFTRILFLSVTQINTHF